MRATARQASAFVAVAGLAGVSGCNLVLGIDDIPPVKVVVVADAGHDAHVAIPDAKADRGQDAVGHHDVGTDVLVREASLDAPVDSGPVGQLPTRTGPETPSTAEINFAIHDLWLGDTAKDTTFTADTSAWASFGYNIDGKVTTSVSTDVCTLAMGASTNVQTDGNEGADNSFGENLVGDLSIVFQGLSKSLTLDIEKGSFTFLLDTHGLTLDPLQTNSGLTTEFFGGAVLGSVPTFTTADNWPVDPSTLADGVSLANGAKISLSDSFVTSGTWVSGNPTDFIFTFQVQGVPLALIFHDGIAAFQHTVDDAGVSHAINGMVAGILEPSEFIGALSVAGGSLSDGEYCPEVNNFVERITASQDILLDGTNIAGQACAGISVAIAFTADEIQPPSIVAPAPAAREGGVPTCGDAGQ